MEGKIFLNELNKPTEETLHLALDKVYSHYKKIMKTVSDFSNEWIYTKGGGWMLKIYDKKKALFYVVPLTNAMKISLAVREEEKKIFIVDDELKFYHSILRNAKRYAEGFALQINISDENGYKMFNQFITKLIKLRK
jgi:hypothetical protein